MADLTDLQAAETVKIVGSNSSGLEQTAVQSTSNGALHTNLRNDAGTEVGTTANPIATSRIMNGSGVQGAISVTTSATAARVGGSNLTNRLVLTIWNNGTQTIYWGFTSGVTSSNGTPLMRNQQLILDVGPSTTIYLIATSGSQDVRITEGA